jgi:hypothetical protein
LPPIAREGASEQAGTSLGSRVLVHFCGVTTVNTSFCLLRTTFKV